MKLGSLFDGSGAFPFAGVLCGIEPVWASEIEKFPIEVTTKRFPNMKHLGDVCKIDGSKIEPVDVITFGSPCFPSGTLVLTDEGYIEIENIKVGMKVLTHEGRWRAVTAIGSKMGETIVLKGNLCGLECTPNHPIFSMGNKNAETEWTAAECMQGKKWATPNVTEPLPINNPNVKESYRIPMPEYNESFFYFVGRWIGDGWVRDGQRPHRPEGQTWGSIIVCSGYEKEEKLKAAVEAITDKYNVERCRTAVKYKFCGHVLCEWLTTNFGKYAYGKKIPAWVYSMPTEWKEALLNGVLDTDGWRETSQIAKVTTTSKKLAIGLRTLGETLGYTTMVYYFKRKPTYVIEGRVVNQRDTYTVKFSCVESSRRYSDGKRTWYRVYKAESTKGNKEVFNLTVDEDNSYIADSIVVHNCQDLSIAGQRAGLEEGERSNLFYEAIRIIKEMREATNGRYPAFAVWENVTGALTSNGGKDFQAVLQNFVGLTDERAVIPRPQGDGGWRDDGLIMGDNYSVAWRVLSAEYWGVPQKRRRIFLVADFGGQRAPKILFEREGLQRDFAEVKRAWGRIDTDCEVGVDETGESARRGVVAIENHPADSRIREQSGDVCQTLTSRMGTGDNNVPMVAEDVTFFDRAMFNQGVNAKMPPTARTDDKSTTLVARGPGAVAYSFSPKSQSGASWENMANTLVASDYKDPQTVTYEQNGEGGQSLLRTHEMVRLSRDGRKDVDDGGDRLQNSAKRRLQKEAER
ncbi:MAG: DNA cytosine methyltransferase [Clostridia bacterium]|nr:DNA cytosine methyltransferase [Clostridia bacterium]